MSCRGVGESGKQCGIFEKNRVPFILNCLNSYGMTQNKKSAGPKAIVNDCLWIHNNRVFHKVNAIVNKKLQSKYREFCRSFLVVVESGSQDNLNIRKFSYMKLAKEIL